MRNLKKLLPGRKREPKVLAVFSNRQADCDQLIRNLGRLVENSPAANYPIYVYCLEKPFETQRCARVVVDPDSRRLHVRAQQELADVWVALSATSWNNHPRGTLLKLIPLTIPPFRGIAGNENGDFFDLEPAPITRHLLDRAKRWCHSTTSHLSEWLNFRAVWSFLRRFTGFGTRIDRLVRYLFGRLPRGAPARLHPGSSPGIDAGLTRVEHHNIEWAGKQTAAIVEESRSRFLLFCPPDCTEDFDDMLPLFENPFTFAVTCQRGFREWRPFSIALSPFRPLSPMEVSRVAAPLGPVLLVDRQKLRKLKMPDTGSFGAAWLEIFWRAGAAGWHSYSVGTESLVPQQQDFSFDEMLFVRRLYLDRELRRMANDAPLLCRGNIGFRPDLVRPFRALPRVLVVSPYLPFPLSHGGAVRIYNLCKSLADQVDFIYICFREAADVVDYEELHGIFRQVYVVDRDEIHHDSRLPEQINHYESSSMRTLISSVAKEQAVDLLQIEYTDMAGYRDAAPQRPAILVEHDLTYTLHRQFTQRDHSPRVREEYERWFRFETGRLRLFDSVFVMSEQDRDEAVGAGANRRRTFVIPNGVDLERFCALPPSSEVDPHIFYVGSFRHLPNYLAFEELRARIMPLVWEKFPRAILSVVAGPDHETHWRSALKGSPMPDLDPRIRVHGFVSDLRPLYQMAHVVVAPLPLSAGTNIKVMEGLACQRAVVGTQAGVQGLGLQHESDVLVCGLGEAFAAAIGTLLKNPALRNEIAARGRTTAETRFGWNAIARDALDAYSVLLQESRARCA